MKLTWTHNRAIGEYHSTAGQRTIKVGRGESRFWFCEILGPVSTYRFRNGWTVARDAKAHAEKAVDVLNALEGVENES